MGWSSPVRWITSFNGSDISPRLTDSGMNTWLALTLGGMVAAGLPDPGVYGVQKDEITVSTKAWGVFCGVPKAFEKSTQGQTVTVAVSEDKWVATGAGRRFGSHVCEGQNLSLRVTETSSAGQNRTIKCESERVVQGTEISTHEIALDKDENQISFISKNLRSFRKSGALCELEVVRKTTLSLQKPEALPLDEPISPPVPQPTSPPVAPESQKASGEPSKPEVSCNVVGEPSKLVFFGEPNPVLFRGEKKCFRVQAQDQKGCGVDWARIKWRVSPRKLGRVNKRGCLYLSETTTRTRGKVVAKLGNKNKTIRFQIQDRPQEPPQVAIAPPSIPPPSKPAVPDAGVVTPQLATVSVAAKAKGKMPTTNTLRPADEAKGLPLWSGGAILLFILGCWFLFKWRESTLKALGDKGAHIESVPKRVDLGEIPRALSVPVLTPAKPRPKLRPNQRVVRAKTRKNQATGTLKPSSHRPYKSGTASTIGPATNRLICRKCNFILPAGHRGVCPLDGSLLEPLTPMVPQPTHRFVVEKRICPACCSEFSAETKECPFDGAHLLPDIGQWDDIKAKIIERNAIAQEEKQPRQASA